MTEEQPSFAPPRDAAKDLIRNQVRSGVSLQRILRTHPSNGGLPTEPKPYSATVGGTIGRGERPNREYVPLAIDEIGVWQLNDQPRFEIFPLRELYTEVGKEEHPDVDSGEPMEQRKLF